MKPSPCLNPKRVYNATLHKWYNVPCGHCAACVCSKGFRLSQRLGETFGRFSYKYFVTLTFSDEYLPIAYYDEQTDSFLHPFDCDYNGVVYSVDSLIVEKSLSNPDFKRSFEHYNGVPVLSHRLAILFKKRLRQNFKKYYGKEYLFIYIVGEYGPSTFRPHYHCVLCTNAPVSSDRLEMCVRESWSVYDKTQQKYISEYGFINFQRVISKGVRNYVAQYLNCSTHLPLVYSSGLFRPFYQSSPLIDTDDMRFQRTDVQSLFASCSPETSCISLLDNTVTVSLYPLGIINRVFPKCYQFGKLTFSDRVQLYALYEKQPFTRAEEFVNCLLNFYKSDTDVLSFYSSLLVDSDVLASRQRILRSFYISRKVCINAKRLGVTLTEYVQRIDLFWSRYELLKLRKFYELQIDLLEDKYNPCTLKDLFALYYDTEQIKHLGYYLNQFDNPCSKDSVSKLSCQS